MARKRFKIIKFPETDTNQHTSLTFFARGMIASGFRSANATGRLSPIMIVVMK
jgi:hypothetical protein